jgi:hypothetical protein
MLSGETASVKEPKSFMKAPDPPVIQPDPMQQQLEQQAKNDQVAALQTRAQGDTASLMARFGALASFAQAAKG